MGQVSEAIDLVIKEHLKAVAEAGGTPAYVFFSDRIEQQVSQLRELFAGRFKISYAVKSNPNLALLKFLSGHVDYLDASSIGEVEAGLAAGFAPGKLSFSGPAKREFELKRSVEIPEMKMVVESRLEMQRLSALAKKEGRRIPVVIRVNQEKVPKAFSMSMAGGPSPFGVDEEQLGDVMTALLNDENLDFAGFHIYSATNSRDASAILENFEIYLSIFDSFSRQFAVPVKYLIFGAGFGIPYSLADNPLDIDTVARKVIPMIDAMRENPFLLESEAMLELGRYLVGGAGYFLTKVISKKDGRGKRIRICDGGMNNHLAACGLMGMILRRPWPMWNITERPGDSVDKYLLAGPLCTTIDTLAREVELPNVEIDDVVAIGSSGAYGLTASPTMFISHPEPREFMIDSSDEPGTFKDISRTK